MSNVRYDRKTGKNDFSSLTKFGEHVTMDTLVLHGLKDTGCKAEKHGIVLYDVYMGWLWRVPVMSRTVVETGRAILDFKGPDEGIKLIYSDQAPESKKTCARLGICHQMSIPGMPSTKGLAENTPQTLLS